MSERFEQMEWCARAGRLSDDASLHQLIQYVGDADWHVRYAAAIALGDRRQPAAVEPLYQLLQAEDAAPLYGQQDDLGGAPAGCPVAAGPHFPEGTDADTRAAWQRRGRLKQAACLALGEIGVADPRVLDTLHRYIIGLDNDYMVRAAASKALGQLASPTSRPFLEQTTQDEEWCTRTEAAKALHKLG